MCLESPSVKLKNEFMNWITISAMGHDGMEERGPWNTCDKLMSKEFFVTERTPMGYIRLLVVLEANQDSVPASQDNVPERTRLGMPVGRPRKELSGDVAE